MRIIKVFPVILAAALVAGCGAFTNGGDDGTQASPTPSGNTLTIMDIQDPSAEKHPEIDSVVTIVDVIVSAIVPDDDRLHFFLQDPAGGDYSGIYVYDQNGVTPSDLTAGDEITITAVYTEFNGASQLVLSTATNLVDKTNTGLTPPVTSVAAADIGTINTTGARASVLEGVLLQIDGDVNVANPSLNNFGEFTVTNGTDEMIVDDYIFSDAEQNRSAGEQLTNLRGILYFAFDEYKLEPRDTNDLPAGTAVPLTAYQLQDPNHADHVGEGSAVMLENMVVTGVRGDGTGAFFVQHAEADYDPAYGARYSGIYIYRNFGGTPSVAVGDVVTVTGTVEEFPNGSGDQMTEVGFAQVTVLSNGATLPAATVVADASEIATGGLNAEAFESVLLSVGAVALQDANPDAPSDFGEFMVTGGLRIDDTLYSDSEVVGRAATNFANITGVLYWSFDNHKLLPRDAADITVQ